MEGIFDRNIALLGEDVQNKLHNTTVLIAGLGGVGGYACEALARLGVGHLILVDYDNIDITNINRQIISNLDNIGNKKCMEFSKRISIINKDCKVDAIDEFINHENVKNIIKDVDYVVDAIDSLESKIEIYKTCLEKNIKIISSMGMANKLDPTKVKITRLDKTQNDKLAKKIRILCRESNIDMKKINVVTSEELGHVEVKDKLPSIILVPAEAGLCCAYYVLNDLLGNI